MAKILDIASEHRDLILQVLHDRGAMTAPDLIQLLNTEYLPRPIRGLDLLSAIRSLIISSCIPAELILAVELTPPLSVREFYSIKHVATEAKTEGRKMLFDELAQEVIVHSGSNRTISDMIFKMRLIMLPLSNDQAEDEHNEEDE